MYETVKAFEDDTEAGVGFARRFAGSRHPSAADPITTISGKGVPKDEKEAVRLYRLYENSITIIPVNMYRKGFMHRGRS
jgi:hypothetical protein